MRFLPLLALFIFTGCSSISPQQRSANRLIDLMAERLSWMDEVAAFKHRHGQPINDPKREAELLASVHDQAVAIGLSPDAARLFMAAQIEAAKQYQREYLELSPKSSSRDLPLPDLAKDVRPALNRISKELVEALARARSQHPDLQSLEAIARKKLRSDGYSDSVIDWAVKGLHAGTSN